MKDKKLLHQLAPGQELGVRWRDASGYVFDNLRKLRLTSKENGNPYAKAYVTWIDNNGISVYIARGYIYGGDIEAFFSKNIMWQSYFEPYSSFKKGYAMSTHYKRNFPIDFIQVNEW